jgi:hypothetical protein
MNNIYMRRLGNVLVWFSFVFLILAQGVSAQSKVTVRNWMALDSNARLNVMKLFIEMAKEYKVILRLPAEYYVKELDLMILNAFQKDGLEGLDSAAGVVIHTIAAMEGDWDNGENKLEHAKKWMGLKQFELFKERYPEKHRRLERASSNSVETPIQPAAPPDRQ